MNKHIRMKKRIVLTLLIIICLCPSEAFSQAGMDPDELLSSGWIIIEAEHCTIMLHPNVNVNKVYRNTKIRFWDILIEKDYHASKEHAIFESIMENFDRTFQKVEKILDMYPRNMNVKVAIYPNQLLLDGKHYEIFGEENTSDREDAYYVHNIQLFMLPKTLFRRKC